MSTPARTLRHAVARQRYILDFTLGALGRRKLKNLSLVVVYALVIFVLASVLLLTESMRHEARLVLAGAPEVLVQRMAAGRHDLIPARDIETLRGIRGVAGVRGRLWGYYYEPRVRANLTLMVPDDFRGGDGEVTLGPDAARLLGVKAGDALLLKGYDGDLSALAVREILPGDSALVSADLVLVSEKAFRTLFALAPDLYTDAALRVPNDKEVSTVAAKVRRLLPAARVITRAEIAHTYESIFDWRGGLLVVILAASLLAFVILAWDKAQGLGAEERRELGVLKAIGWDTGDVLAVKLWEGALVSGGAFALGLLGAYAHVFLTPVALFAPVLKGWSTLYPALRPAPLFAPALVAVLFFLTVLPYTIATVVPAWRAATTDPDEVMRS